MQVEQFSVAKADSSLTLTGVIRTGAGRPQVELNATGQLGPEVLASRLGGVAPWSGHLAVKGKIVAETTPRTFKANLLLETGPDALWARRMPRFRAAFLR